MGELRKLLPVRNVQTIAPVRALNARITPSLGPPWNSTSPAVAMIAALLETFHGTRQTVLPVTGKTVWRVPWKVANNAAVLATAGDVLFQGGPNEGVMRAFNAKTGQIVWTFRTGSNFRSSPISYQGPDGRQYVAIIGSQLGANTQVKVDAPADSDARFRRSGATLYVFALPRTAAR